MRKEWMVIVGILIMAGSVWGAPEVTFIAPGPGIHVPLDNVTTSNPSTYGKLMNVTGTWTYDADAASTSSLNASLLYKTTQPDNTTEVAMPGTKDWVMEISYKHVGGYNGGIPWFTYAGSNRVISLWHDNTTSWSIRTGNGSGGWTAQVSGLVLGSSYHTFMTHYKADVQRLDIYMDGNLLASNIALGHGVYTLSSVQLEDADAASSTDSYRYLKVGQLAPPVHAIEDAIGSSNGSSIINVITYYMEHFSEYPEDIDINDPASSNWSPLIEDIVDNMDSSRGRIIFFPGGLYRCTSTINIHKPSSTPLTFMGVGHASANLNLEGSVLKYEGATHLFKLYGPMSNFNLKDIQLEGPGVQNDQTAVRADIAGGNVNKCTFENLKINNFKRGFYFPGDADGMAFRDIRFANINRCIYLQRADAVVIEHIEGEPFYEYMLYLDQCSGVMVNNVLAVATTTTPARAFILTGSGTAGKSIEINGVHAEFVNNLATVTCPNVSLKNFFYYSTPGDPIHDDAFVFAQVSDQQPENCLIENASFELDCDRNGTKDISLRTSGTVNLIESTPTVLAGSSCNGLRIINSEMDMSGIPTTSLVEKYSRGEQWVGNQLKRAYGTASPTYAGNQGDIVWNIQPVANGYIGWICVGGSTWKGFGKIAS
ncbi:MAG: hypothetical protein WC975_12270 [Phycisphaerae bacterium]